MSNRPRVPGTRLAAPDLERLVKLSAAGVDAAALATRFCVSRASVYRIIARMQVVTCASSSQATTTIYVEAHL